MNGFKIFTGNSNPDFAKKVCDYLGEPLGSAKVNKFSDGEIQIEIQENVRSQEVFIVQSMPIRMLHTALFSDSICQNPASGL